jgi:phosphatidylinositol kinase/protein kinase (PI-3  family)
MPIEENLSP